MNGESGDYFKPVPEGGFHIVSLGEVMLRLDPGDRRITTADPGSSWGGVDRWGVRDGARLSPPRG